MKQLLLATTCLALSSTVSMAADMSVPYTTKAPVMAAPVFSWTGCYVGAQVGGGTMTANSEGTSTSNNGKGALAGGQLGCNYQDGNWVFGLEGEGYWSNIKVNQSSVFGPFDSFNGNFTNRDDFTIAARAGITFDRTWIYGKGGWAWGSFRGNTTSLCCSSTSTLFTTTQSGDLDGFLVGAGIEHALTRNWTVKLEYDYIAFGAKSFSTTGCGTTCGTPFSVPVSATKQVFKVGANYLFDFGGGPVVAKY
jgi:outer membrane immunogenic protein